MTISKKKTAFWLQCALAVCNVVLYYKASWADVLSYEGDVAPFIVIIIPLVCLIGAAIEAGLLIISRHLTPAKSRSLTASFSGCCLSA